MRLTNGRRGIAAAAVGGIIVVIIVVGILAVYFALLPTTHAKSTSTPTIETVTLIIPAVATTSPTGWSYGDAPVIGNQFFSPANATLVVSVNNTVVWDNPNPVLHSVTSITVPSGASGFNFYVENNSTVPFTFTVPGAYLYYCTFHPWMGGAIVVKNQSSSSS